MPKMPAKKLKPSAPPMTMKKFEGTKEDKAADKKAIAKINASLVKLNERKAKITAEIAALKDQRAALKAPPVAAAPAAAPAKPAKAAKAPKAAKAK